MRQNVALTPLFTAFVSQIVAEPHAPDLAIAVHEGRVVGAEKTAVGKANDDRVRAVPICPRVKLPHPAPGCAVVLADADTDARTADIPVGAKDRAGAKMDQARAVAPEVDLLSGAEPWFDKLTTSESADPFVTSSISAVRSTWPRVSRRTPQGGGPPLYAQVPRPISGISIPVFPNSLCPMIANPYDMGSKRRLDLSSWETPTRRGQEELEQGSDCWMARRHSANRPYIGTAHIPIPRVPCLRTVRWSPATATSTVVRAGPA